MAYSTTSYYVGNTLINQSFLGDQSVFINPNNTFQYGFRNDPYSASLVLALPLSYFPSLGMSSETSDVHKQINTAGSANYTISTLGTAGNTYASSSIVKFPNDGYTQSYVTKLNGALTAPNNTEFSMGSDAFTVEGWIYCPSGTPTSTFYWKYVAGNPATSEILYDYQSGASRYALDYGTSGECFNNSGTSTFSNGTWYHFAFSRTAVVGGTGGVISVYFNGVRVSLSSCVQTINTTSTVPQFIGYSGGSNSTNAFQDYRIYKGVAKYSGATITPPESIIYKVY